MVLERLKIKRLFLYFSFFFIFSVVQGCVATRGWVREELGPLRGRVRKVERNIVKTDGRVKEMGGTLSSVKGEVKATKAKTYKALVTLANLKLERKLVLHLKEGALFSKNSAWLSEPTKREIDGFLSDLKSDLKDSGRTIFLVTGHTDSIGTVDYNYELGKKRADQVARHLIVNKGIHPTQITSISYGEKAPIEQNITWKGRRKNRRVEILVYNEGINSSSEMSAAQ